MQLRIAIKNNQDNWPYNMGQQLATRDGTQLPKYKHLGTFELT